MTRRGVVSAASILALTLAAAGAAQAEWVLQQNDPNPFCNDPGEAQIRFAVDVESRILLRVWGTDFSEVLRVLIDGRLPAGLHTVIWNGEDDDGHVLPEGQYPYRLEATDSDTGEILFEDTLIAAIECATPTAVHAWGRIRSLYR
jgi:hypothetical protein